MNTTQEQKSIILEILSTPKPGGFTRRQVGLELGIKKNVLGNYFRDLCSKGLVWPIRRGECPISKRWATFYTANESVRDMAKEAFPVFEERRTRCRVCGRVLTETDKCHEGNICNNCQREKAHNRSIEKTINKNLDLFPSLPGEEWRQIAGHADGYLVSNIGRIRLKTGRISRLGHHRQGYLWTRIEGKHHLVHRLVAEAFIPNPDNKPVINHKNGQKDDNRIQNLEWVTQSENCLHAFKIGVRVVTKKQLDRCREGYKLNDDQIREIRERCSAGEKQCDIAEGFGVSKGHIYAIVKRKKRKSVL